MSNWSKTTIVGVNILSLNKHVDERGFLVEVYRNDELPEGFIPAMSYVSYTEPGVARGPHEHIEQTDFFVFIGPGNFMLKLWDNRHDSITYGSQVKIFVGRDNPCCVIVPPGIVHGYKNISRQEKGMVLNYPNRLYRGCGKKDAVDEIRHEDSSDSAFSMED